MIQYITYKGEKLPVRLGYYALKHTKIDTGKEFVDINTDTIDYDVLECGLYYSLVQGYKFEGKKCPYEKTDMEEILDECLFQFIEVIANFIPKAGGEGSKKK